MAHHLESGEAPAYAPGSAEERNLRNNTRYIAPEADVILVGALSLLIGALVTFVIVFAPLYAFAHAWGWLLRWQAALAPARQHVLVASVPVWTWALPAAAGIVTCGLFLRWWLMLAPRSPGRGSSDASRVWRAALIAAALAVATLAVPAADAWLFASGGVTGTIVHFFGFGTRISWSPAAVAGLITAVAAAARYSQAGLARWQPAGPGNSGQGQGQGQGLLARVGTVLRQRLLPWLGSAVVVLAVLAALLLWTGDGARAGFDAAQLWPVLVAVAVMLLTRLVVDVNRLSMHDFYRWRLASAYAVTRSAASQQDPAEKRRQFAEAASTMMSSLGGSPGDAPELVICATANVNAARETPPGQGGFCMTFDPAHVTLHREKGSAERDPAMAGTADYEALIGRDRFTLFDVSAISGAAISPLMGAATRQAYRILLTTANVRLGVWMPHPRVVGRAREAISDAGRADAWWTRRPPLLALWYLSPHPRWDRDYERNLTREARLWAHVLKLRLAAAHGERGHRLRGALWYRLMQPTLGLLWAEAVGHTSYRSTWINVTDGGHYDDLALVAALRLGATHVLVLDASGDKADTWFNLGKAIALARTDQGVEVQLDPTVMIGAPDPDDPLKAGQVVQPWAHGTFTRQGDDPQLPAEGQIWVAKLGWWRHASWDVQAYAARHPTFPGDPTLEQLYDGAEFEAYRELGAAAVLEALRHGILPVTSSASRVFVPEQAERVNQSEDMSLLCGCALADLA